jgi:hypothetical protein
LVQSFVHGSKIGSKVVKIPNYVKKIIPRKVGNFSSTRFEIGRQTAQNAMFFLFFAIIETKRISKIDQNNHALCLFSKKKFSAQNFMPKWHQMQKIQEKMTIIGLLKFFSICHVQNIRS